VWNTGADLGFIKEVGWYPGLAESMVPNCCSLRIGTELKTVSLEIPAMPQSINYNEVPVQRVFLYFCHNIHNLFQIFLCFASPKGGREGRLATQSTPPLPLICPWEHELSVSITCVTLVY